MMQKNSLLFLFITLVLSKVDASLNDETSVEGVIISSTAGDEVTHEAIDNLELSNSIKTEEEPSDRFLQTNTFTPSTSLSPTIVDSARPSASPTTFTSALPSAPPTITKTVIPSASLTSMNPTIYWSDIPSVFPTVLFSKSPSASPSSSDTFTPSISFQPTSPITTTTDTTVLCRMIDALRGLIKD